jgi:hypothetical protein
VSGMATNDEFSEDYAALVGRLVPEKDRLDDEETQELMEIRNKLILFSAKTAEKRAKMYSNDDPYALLFLNDMILQQFFIMVFHNKHMAYYQTLQAIFDEQQKKYKV